MFRIMAWRRPGNKPLSEAMLVTLPMHISVTRPQWDKDMFNTLRPKQNGCDFADIFKCIFLNEDVWIPFKISLKPVPKGPIYNIPALVEIMARCQPGDKPLSQPMMINLLKHICVTRPQWVKVYIPYQWYHVEWWLDNRASAAMALT